MISNDCPEGWFGNAFGYYVSISDSYTIVGTLGTSAYIYDLNEPPVATVSSIPERVRNSKILLHVDYSDTDTDWDIDRIRADYPDSVIENGYLFFEKDFSDYDAPSDRYNQPDQIPVNTVFLKFLIGEDKQVYVATDSDSPWAYALFASGNSLGNPWGPTGLSADDVQVLFDNGIKFGIEPSVKLTTLFAIQFYEYGKWVEKGYVVSPLSKTDRILLLEANIRNFMGKNVVSVVAGIATRWGAMEPPYIAETIDTWWPKGSSDDTGDASWSFDFDVINPEPGWYSDITVSGDVGTTQTVYWNDEIKLIHNGYCSLQEKEVLSSVPVSSVKLEYKNVWSGGGSYVSFTFLADDVVFSNIRETPAVGDTPYPRKIIFPGESAILELSSENQVCMNGSAVASVPLILNNTSIGIEAVDVKVEFDNEVLIAKDVTLTGGVLADKNYEIISQVNDQGGISATIYANADLFTGNGVIAYLNFYVIGDEEGATELTFTKAKLNESSVEAGNGSAEVTTCLYDISGNIGYYSNGFPVSDVLVEPIAYESAKTYSPLDSDRADQDFVAVRLGDVTGNWSDDPVRTRRESHSVCEADAVWGSVLTVPAVLSQAEAVEGIDMKLTFDADVLELRGATLAGGILEKEGYALLKNTKTDGEAVFVVSASGSTVTGIGEVLFLEFEVAGDPGDTSFITFEKFECNEKPMSGGFQMDGKACQSLSLGISGGNTDVVTPR